MKINIEKKVEELLQEGYSKKAVWNKLKDADNPRKVLYYVNNSSMPPLRKKYQYLNLVLVVLLTFITVKKLLVAFSFGALDLALLLSLVVPIVNIHILREILRFRRLGYKFLCIVSLLSLVHPENRYLQETSILLTLSALSGYILVSLFPKTDMIALPD